VEPGLAAKASDGILPLVAGRILPGWLGAMVIAGGLAALMSTMDSQLLTLSSMVVRDSGLRRLSPRIAVVVLAGAGLAIAFRPPAPLLDIATETFTGLAVLFPVTVAAIYLPRLNPWAGFASIVTGEALVALYHYKLLPAFGLLPVIPVTLVTTLVLVVGSLAAPSRREPLARLAPGAWRWLAALGLLFLLAIDFWNWGRALPLVSGLPNWVWYSVGLNLLLFAVFARMSRARLFLGIED
jgi:SSS family solute:Na+ symporter